MASCRLGFFACRNVFCASSPRIPCLLQPGSRYIVSMARPDQYQARFFATKSSVKTRKAPLVAVVPKKTTKKMSPPPSLSEEEELPIELQDEAYDAPELKKAPKAKKSGTTSASSATKKTPARMTKDEIQKAAESFESYLRISSDAEGAIRLFEKRPPEIKALTYDAAIQLASRTNILKAQQFYREMLAAKIKPTAATFDDLIYSPDRRLTFDKGVFYYKEMLRQGIKPTDNTLHQLLELCSAHHRASDAMVFFEETKRRWGITPTRMNYQLLIDLLRKEHRLPPALKYFHELESVGYLPSEDAIVHLVVVCCRQNMLDEALKIYTKYEDRDLPHPKLIGLIGMACGRLRRPDDVIRVYNRWRAKGGVPDFAMLNTIIDACSRSRKPELALEYLNEMRRLDYEPTEVTLSLMMRAYGPRNLKAALSYYESMKQAGIANINTYTQAMKICNQAGDYQRVHKIWSDMLFAGCTPTTSAFSTIVLACGKAGQEQKLLELFEHMKDYGLRPDEEVYAAMITSFGQLGNYDEAQRYFFGVEQAGLQQSEVTYSAMITAAGLCNNAEKAVGFFNEMKVLQMRLTGMSYEAIIKACIRCHQVELALHYYQDMLATNVIAPPGLRAEVEAAVENLERAKQKGRAGAEGTS